MPLLKLQDAANELNVSERTVQRLVKRGQIRYVRIGHSSLSVTSRYSHLAVDDLRREVQKMAKKAV